MAVLQIIAVISAFYLRDIFGGKGSTVQLTFSRNDS